jgi:hypothetical protein
MTAWAMGLGASVAAVLVASFPIAMAVLPDTPDLRVTTDSSGPYVIRQSAAASTPVLRVEPSPSPGGVAVADTSVGPGLDLRTWDVTYSHRWDRAVTLPILTGPFVREGEEVCGLSVAIGAGLFDTSAGGAGFQQILQTKLSELLPYTYTHPQYQQVSVTFPRPRQTTMKIGLVPGRIAFLVHLVLEDDTLLDVYFVAGFAAVDGAPALVRQGQVWHNWRGPTLDRLLQEAAAVGASVAAEEHPVLDFFFEDAVRSEGARIGRVTAEQEGNAQADRKLTEFVDSALRGMSAGFANLRGPHHPLPGNPTASVFLRLNGAPIVSTKGIALRLCLSGQIGAKVASAVPGSVRVGDAGPAASAIPSGDSSIEVSADGETLRQLLYLLWQSGGLRDLGTSKSLVQAALDGTRDADGSESALQKLAFEFRGFDPGLPPTIVAGSGSSIGLAVGDVRIGDWDGRRVVTHAMGTLALDTSGEKIVMTTTLSQLTANCTSSIGGATLTPCVSDLMPSVREALLGRQVRADIPGGDLLAKLPSMSFGGARLQLAGLRATTNGSPVRLSLKVGAAIVGEAP